MVDAEDGALADHRGALQPQLRHPDGHGHPLHPVPLGKDLEADHLHAAHLIDCQCYVASIQPLLATIPAWNTTIEIYNRPSTMHLVKHSSCRLQETLPITLTGSHLFALVEPWHKDLQSGAFKDPLTKNYSALVRCASMLLGRGAEKPNKKLVHMKPLCFKGF